MTWQGYLRNIQNPQYFNNAALYGGDEPPFEAPSGWEWVPGSPDPEGVPLGIEEFELKQD